MSYKFQPICGGIGSSKLSGRAVLHIWRNKSYSMVAGAPMEITIDAKERNNVRVIKLCPRHGLLTSEFPLPFTLALYKRAYRQNTPAFVAWIEVVGVAVEGYSPPV